MKKLFSYILFTAFLLPVHLRADEGMWLLNMLKKINEGEMQSMGMKLSADQIYSVNNSSVKDAIVSFGGFCTGEMISKNGLLLTNHHCGLDAIQSHSTTEHDYLTNGFWAKTHKDELPNPGLFVRFLVRMEDVTEKIKAELSDTLTETARQAAITRIGNKLSKEATEGTHYTAEVRSMFHGDEFYMFVYETFKDVRMVGAPPSSIGNYGGDTDNWMWPRHTGDFSIFRVYCGKDGKPADYSEDNIPYTPKHHLPVSLKGIKEGDFSMIIGYPGRTERYLTSGGVEMAIDMTSPSVVKVRELKLEIMRNEMKKSDKVRIQYQSKHNRTSNYWKYFIGQIKQLKRMRVADQKKDQERRFTEWANADASRKAKYGTVASDLRKAYEDMRQYANTRIYLREAILQGAEILPYAYSFDALATALSKKETPKEEISKMTASLSEGVEEHFKDYHQPIDRQLLSAMLKMYYNDIPKDQQSDLFREIEKKYKGNFEKYADDVFKKSMFTSADKVKAFLAKPDYKKLSNDPAYKGMKTIIDHYNANIRGKVTAIETKLNALNRAYIKGSREMYPNRKFFPDANSTMRLTYGKVKAYAPADAVQYNWFTTIDGVMEKMDNSNPEFVVQDNYVKLYNHKDFGQYGEAGNLRVCFISDNDITGGNSGSGVMNGEGHLIGLAFDGNWEAMSGDIAFDPAYKRTINTDIRYVLWVIEKIGNARHLIDEMTVIK
ncbi:MAG: S46 family peptidase [Bacteroidia bacterium]|nr:S46 family peptidase [Bacteroidia bacterium]